MLIIDPAQLLTCRETIKSRDRTLSTSSAESFAKAALSPNKTTDQKIELIAKALIELSKTMGSMERDISRIKNAGTG